MTTYTEHQHELIEQHRHISVEDNDWYESTFDHFIDLTGQVGLDVETRNIQFSGFWSQGDGASFTFSSYGLNAMLDKCDQFLAEHNAMPDEQRTAHEEQRLYRELLAFAQNLSNTYSKYRLLGGEFFDEILGGVYLVAERTSHRYSHARTVTAKWNTEDADRTAYQTRYEEGWKQLMADLDDKWADSVVEDIANALYAALEDEHDHLTSDEAVWDAIVANDLDEPEEDEEEDEEDVCEAA